MAPVGSYQDTGAQIASYASMEDHKLVDDNIQYLAATVIQQNKYIHNQ